MKKFLIFLIACVALTQSIHSATSALTESLLEYEAITLAIGSDPNFQNVIPVNQFIVDIKRITKEIAVLGQVKYRIVTRTVTDDSSRKNRRTSRYIAKLNVSPNPGIGPNIVTVVSIVPVGFTRFHRHDND